MPHLIQTTFVLLKIYNSRGMFLPGWQKKLNFKQVRWLDNLDGSQVRGALGQVSGTTDRPT